VVPFLNLEDRIAEELILTPAQEFREARDWLAQHRRDPYLWLIFLMTFAMFTFNFVGIAVLGSAFPASDAQPTIGQDLPSVDLKIGDPKVFCKLPHSASLFGYDLIANGKRVGRICRDIVNGGWVWTFDDPEFKKFEPR
jgi:hypothetical protein